MPIDSPFDNLTGIRSLFGRRRAQVSQAPSAFTAGDWEFVWKEAADVVPQGFGVSEWEFVYREEAVPATAPAGRVGEPIISKNVATYGTFVSVLIPTFANIPGKRVFYLTYGRKDVPEGTFAEGAGSYCRIMYHDYDSTVTDTMDASNFKAGAFVLPPATNDAMAGDPYMHPLPDGRMYLSCFVATDQAEEDMACYACILMNPLADPADWDFGPWSYVGDGFGNCPHTHKGEVRQVTAPAPGSGSPRYLTYDPSFHVMSYNRIVPDGRVVTTELISTVPNAPVSDANQGTHEASFASYGTDSILCTFRTDLGPYDVVSTDNGATWGTPALVDWSGVNPSTVISKTNLAVSPTGRLIWGYNAETTGFSRFDMTIAIFTDPSVFDTTPAVDFTIDTRGGAATSGTAVSYPDIDFIYDGDGNYTGEILFAYDYGRGDPASANETYIVKLVEQDLIDNAPISDGDATYFTRYTYGP